MTPMMVLGIRSTRPVWANSISCLVTDISGNSDTFSVNSDSGSMSDIFEIQYKEDQTIRVLKTIMNIRSQLISFLNTSGSKPVTRMLV